MNTHKNTHDEHTPVPTKSIERTLKTEANGLFSILNVTQEKSRTRLVSEYIKDNISSYSALRAPSDKLEAKNLVYLAKAYLGRSFLESSLPGQNTNDALRCINDELNARTRLVVDTALRNKEKGNNFESAQARQALRIVEYSSKWAKDIAQENIVPMKPRQRAEQGEVPALA